MRVDDVDDLRLDSHSQSRSRSGQIQKNANGKLLPSAEALNRQLSELRNETQMSIMVVHAFGRERSVPDEDADHLFVKSHCSAESGWYSAR